MARSNQRTGQSRACTGRRAFAGAGAKGPFFEDLLAAAVAESYPRPFRVRGTGHTGTDRVRPRVQWLSSRIAARTLASAPPHALMTAVLAFLGEMSKLQLPLAYVRVALGAETAARTRRTQLVSKLFERRAACPVVLQSPLSPLSPLFGLPGSRGLSEEFGQTLGIRTDGRGTCTYHGRRSQAMRIKSNADFLQTYNPEFEATHLI